MAEVALKKLGGYPERRMVEQRFNDVFLEYDNWKPRWVDLTRNISPDRGVFDNSEPNRGERRDQFIINSTPIDSNGILAAGMQSGMTSLSRPWFKLGMLDPELSEYKPVRSWLDKVAEQILGVYARTNIYECTHNVYEELGCAGTGALIILEDFDSVMRGQTFTIGEYAVATGADGRVNVFARKLMMTVAQMIEQFGYDNCSTSVQNMWDRGRLSERYEVHHLIEPNDDRIPGMVDALNKPFRSAYWQPGTRDKWLAVRGFEEFPVMVPRWQVTKTGDYYGRGPGWKALGDSKQLQRMEKDKLQIIALVGKPPIKAPSSAKNTLINILPGGITFHDDNGNGGVQPTFQVDARIEPLSNEIREVEQRIKRAFYADLFLMMVESDRRQITATEVEERHEEKLLIIGPTLERLQNDFYDPMISRSFAILQRSGLLPEIPRELRGKIIKVDYISILAQAQKAVSTAALAKVAAFAGNLANIQMANAPVLDGYNFDISLRKYGEALGVSPDVLRSMEELAKIRAQRDADMAQQQAMMQAQAATESAKNLASADMSRNNALTAIMGGPM